MSKEINELRKNWELVGTELKGIVHSVNIVFETLTKIMKAEDKITLKSTKQMNEAREIMAESNDLMQKMASEIRKHETLSRQDL